MVDKYKKEFNDKITDKNPFFKNIQKSTQERPSNRRNYVERRKRENNYRPRQYQYRFERNFNYDRNVRPQIPYKEIYDRNNFSNWQTNRRNEEALENFRATQERFLDQRRPFRTQK